MKARIRRTLLVAATLVPSALFAQGVTVQSVSDIRFYGALGTMANIAARVGGMDMRETPSTTVIWGKKMKVESRDAASVIDAETGRFTNIDHKGKSYTSMTMAEMAAAIEQAGRQGGQKAKAEAAQASKDPNAPKGEVKFKTSVSVERPGDRAKVAGYDAERVFLTVTIEAEATPEGEKTEQVGSLVFFLDEWMSKDAPQILATQEFQRAYAETLGQTFRPSMEKSTDKLQAAFNADPRIKVGFEASMKELEKIQGIALKSMTYVAAVPAGLKFDRQLALGAVPAEVKKDDKPKTGGFRGLMGAIKSAAEEANKQQPADKNAPQELKQATLLSMLDEVKNITRGSVPAETFEVPAGYREIKQTIPR